MLNRQHSISKLTSEIIFPQNKVRRIKVIHIYKDFDTFNGLIARFFVIAKYIDRTLFDPIVCVFNYEGGAYGKKFQGVGGKLLNLNFNFGVKGVLNTIFRLSRFLNKQKPDIVVTHDRRGNFFGILAARKAGVPVIISTETTLMDVAPTLMKRLRDRLFHPLLQYLVSLSDAFIVNSESIRRQWKFRESSRKSIVIYPPFSLEKYREILPFGEKPNKEPRSSPILGYIGRLSAEKGLNYLIEALTIVKDSFPKIILLVGGTGEKEHYFKALVRRKNLDRHVSFLGFQTNSFNLLSQIDLLVVPSRSEGFGNIALEGITMGIPVIASCVGGLKEILSDGVGILVPPKDEKSLANAIISLLGNPQEMKRMGERGKNRAFELFHPAKYIQRLEGLYIRLLQEKNILNYHGEKNDSCVQFSKMF